MTGGTYFPLFIQLNHTNPSQTIATILNITKPRPTILTKARKPPLLQVIIDMNKVKKVLGINRVKRLGKKVTVIH